MDCRTARYLLDYHRPGHGELPPDEVAELEHHLSGCTECDAVGRAERRFDEALAPVMSNVPVPEGLKERLLSRLREERGAVLRRRAAWTLRVAAVAAAVLLGVGLWLHYRVVPSPQLDLLQIASDERDQYHPSAASTVENWFQTKHQITMTAPPFDYKYLAHYDLAHVQGKPVPKLAFHRDEPDIRASVYCVTRGQFDLDALKPEDAVQFETGGGPHLRILRSNPEFAYVVFYDGNDLDSLMPKDEVR